MTLQEHLDIQNYDKYYQDIEHIHLIGYAKSLISWNNIKDLVDWKGKTVVDVGCFHGYFCFKAEQEGADMVIGIERNPDVVKTTKMIAKRIDSKCIFRTQDVDQVNLKNYPCDVLLCLNVFHHFKEQDKFLSSLNPKQKIIFEIDKEDLTKVQKYCIIVTQKDSHRASAHTGDTPNRLVILAEKKAGLCV